MLPGYSDITAADLPALLPTDKYIEELIVMADVRSYFQVAYKVRVPLLSGSLRFSAT